jgi:hypothetical protein
VPPLATGSVPVTPVDRGSPVTFVSVPEAGVPRAGVTSVGDVAKTRAPVPVSLVTAAAKFALVGVARKVATPVPKPETPVEIGNPVAFVSVAADGVPNAGVTNVGEVAKTANPVPVSSVSAAARFAELGVPRKAATPVPNPDTPVDIGRPVAFVSVAEAGVPRTGVTKVGDVANTTAPVPVSSVRAVARLIELGVARNVATPAARPDTPVEIGRPVALVRVADAGVPKAPPTKYAAPAPTSSVRAARRFALVGVARNVATPVPSPDTPVEIGSPVALVRVTEVGVPRIGVTNVGEVAKTAAPVPVSSVSAASKLALVGVARKVAIPVAGVKAPNAPLPALI